MLKCFKLAYKQLRTYTTSLPSIYALATGASQPCGIAVVRISGTKCLKIIEKMTNSSTDLEPTKLYYKNIYHPKSNVKIDKALVVWFKGPKSFTGEDVCEFHCHGGPAILALLFDALSTFDGIRMAEPGEFSKRAFLNGQMDLTEIEGLCDLINAETELQRQQALNQMQGSLSVFYTKCRENIMKSLANVEAYIDFNEEENIEPDVLEQIKANLVIVKELIETHLNDNRRGERLRNGIRIVIIGEPNAGKSSLLNYLSQKNLAIVSPIPGTTRDIIESAINLSGFPVLLSDTAGLRQTDDNIEIEGVRRAKERVAIADVLVVLVDVGKHYQSIKAMGLNKFIQEHLFDLLTPIQSDIMDNILKTKSLLVGLNKTDLLSTSEIVELKRLKQPNDRHITHMSCLNEHGLDNLLDGLKSRLDRLCQKSNSRQELPLITQQRHRDNLIKCVECIDSYLHGMKGNQEDIDRNIVINAEHLRNATKFLGKITGQITNEQILDVIFKDFCIGK